MGHYFLDRRYMQYMISLKIFIFVFYNMFSYFNSSRVESADLRIKKTLRYQFTL